MKALRRRMGVGVTLVVLVVAMGLLASGCSSRRCYAPCHTYPHYRPYHYQCSTYAVPRHAAYRARTTYHYCY